MKMLVVVVVAAAVAGCQQTPRAFGEQRMTDAEIEAKDDGVCRSFGIARGASGYADCRLRLRSDRANQDAIRRSGGRVVRQF